MKILVLDTEHSPNIFRPWEEGFYLTCVGMIMYNETGEIYRDTIWFDHSTHSPTMDAISIIQRQIKEVDLVVAQNTKHDITILNWFGIDIYTVSLWCTMVADYLIHGHDKTIRYDLDSITERYGLEQKLDEVKAYWEQGYETYDIPADLLERYCYRDCELTYQSYLKQVEQLQGKQLYKVVNLQNEFIRILSTMECNGLEFDQERAHEIVKYSTNEAERLSKELLKDFEYGEYINLSSSQHLSVFLYGGLLKYETIEWVQKEFKYHSSYKEQIVKHQVQVDGVGFTPVEKMRRKDGYYRVDKDTIKGLNSPSPAHRKIKKLLHEYSNHKKVVSSLIGQKGDKGLLSKIQPDNRIHPKFNQAITASGRLSSSDPNGQNLPRGSTSPIKECIIPRYAGIAEVDLSQIEWRDAAWLSQDPIMIKEINEGIDQHAATVVELMELEYKGKDHAKSKENRYYAKIFNFRMIYGGSEWGFYFDVNMPQFSIKKWRQIIDNFFNKYVGLKNWHNRIIQSVFKQGYLVAPTGRWWKFYKKTQKNGQFGYALNQIKNLPVQGMSGGDILPLLAIHIADKMFRYGMKSIMILTVHDSIVFDYVAEERDKLARICYEVGNNLAQYIEDYYGFQWNVNLEVEFNYGPNFGNLTYLPYEDVK